MRIKKLYLSGITVLAAVLSLGLLLPAQAAVQPSIEGGDIYRVRNITKGGGFTDPATADKCDELQYRVRIHNPGPDGGLTNVVVKAVIPPAASTQNVSTVTVSASNASPNSVSDTATVNLSTAQKINYVPGSSQLLDANGAVISSIGDVTAGSGVNIGNVGISVQERRFVQFKAKVDCPPEQPPVKNFACTALNVTSISRTKFKFTAVASVQNVTIQNYVFTARNQANTVVDTKTVTTGATTADYEFENNTPGTYTISAVINTDAGATNPDVCTKQVTIVEEGKPVPPPVTPQAPAAPAAAAPAPTELPAAGPTDVAVITGIVTVLSSAAYYAFSRRPF